ncbi:MAG: cofactor-independent phosphoglycerate mutase [Kiritimatiellia bacterium]
MRKQSTVIFLGDGMADEPVPELGLRTPLEVAHTPAMDFIAREGCNGTLLTLPDGFPTSSEVANMSVLGCDLAAEYCGRGPLEAAGAGVPIGPSEIAFRLNLITVENGVLKDFAGGRPTREQAECLMRELQAHFGSEVVRFYPGVSYRNLLVLSGLYYSDRVAADKPDDNHGQRLEDHLPRPLGPEAEETVELLRRLMLETPRVLEKSEANRRAMREGRLPANGVWPWSGGRTGTIHTLREKYGISGAVISAVDVINGLGRCLGMDVIRVAGATGYIDTNYEGKADAAIEAARLYDLVYVHVEGIDEVSHDRRLDLKLKAIEDFDARLIARVLEAIGDDINVAVLADHPVPVKVGKHTRTPVPVAVRAAGLLPDSVTAYDEVSCTRGSLGAMKDGEFMQVLFGSSARRC